LDFAGAKLAYPDIPLKNRILAKFPDSVTSPPVHWNTNGDGLVMLSDTSPVFKEVAMMFRSTLDYPSFSSSYYIHSIEMKCSIHEFDVYNAVKKKFKAELGHCNERWLWHGCCSANVDAILKNGFERSYSVAQAYGAGVYFAKNSSYSWNGYSVPETISSTESEKIMLLSRVLLGDSCRGSGGKQHPDKKEGGKNDGMLYNSIFPTGATIRCIASSSFVSGDR
jgi:hypothetical protein